MADSTQNLSQYNVSTHDSYEEFTLDTEMKVIFSFLGLAACLIALANSLVFVLAWHMKYLRTKTNFFLLSLAASDLLAGVLVIPLVISCNIVILNESLCIAMDICQRGLAISTILHLSSAVMERYLKISSPFKYDSIVTKPRIAAVLISVWITAMSVSLAQLPLISSPDIMRAYLIYNTTVISLFVFVPFIVTIGAFNRIFVIMKQSKKSRQNLTTRRNSNKVQQKRKQRRNVKRSLIVYFVMLVCFACAWFPYFFLTLLIDLENSHMTRIPQWISVMFLFLKVSSALFNPLLFTFFKADFQRALRQMASRNWSARRDGTKEITRKTGSHRSANRSTYHTHLKENQFEMCWKQRNSLNSRLYNDKGFETQPRFFLFIPRGKRNKDPRDEDFPASEKSGDVLCRDPCSASYWFSLTREKFKLTDQKPICNWSVTNMEFLKRKGTTISWREERPFVTCFTAFRNFCFGILLVCRATSRR